MFGDLFKTALMSLANLLSMEFEIPMWVRVMFLLILGYALYRAYDSAMAMYAHTTVLALPPAHHGSP